MIGIVAAGLAAGAVCGPSSLCSIASSARTFQRYFRDLKTSGDSLSTVERVVFSLVLTNAKATPPEQHTPSPRHRI